MSIFFGWFFVNLLWKKLSNKMVINLSKWPQKRSKLIKIQFLNPKSFIMQNESIIRIMNGKSGESMIWHIKKMQQEINKDIVIKMFKNLKPKVHIAFQNSVSSLLKFWNYQLLPYVTQNLNKYSVFWKEKLSGSNFIAQSLDSLTEF